MTVTWVGWFCHLTDGDCLLLNHPALPVSPVAQMECARHCIPLVVELQKWTSQWGWVSHYMGTEGFQTWMHELNWPLHDMALVRYWGKHSHILWFTKHLVVYSLPWKCCFLSVHLENSYSSFKSPFRCELCGLSLTASLQYRTVCSNLCVLPITPSSNGLWIHKAKGLLC